MNESSSSQPTEGMLGKAFQNTEPPEEFVNHSVEAAKRLAGELQQDKLTGLLNQTSFMDHLNEQIASGRKLGISFLDLRNFKRLNDTEGHAAGDKVLKRIADVLSERIRKDDVAGRVIGRLGGDEIGIIYDLSPRTDGIHEHAAPADLTDEKRLELAQNRVYEAFANHPEIQLSGVDVSMGSTVIQPGESGEIAKQRAEELMYEHKATQGESYRS